MTNCKKCGRELKLTTQELCSVCRALKGIALLDLIANEEPTRSTEFCGAALDSIGRYRVLDSLGKGGFGDVFLALDERLGRKVAIKLIRLRAGVSTEAGLKEGRLLAKMKHPNIASAFDAGALEDGRIYIVSPYAQGGDLRDKIRGERRLDPWHAARVIMTLAQALHYVHETFGIYHLDIKPANILLGPTGEPVLTDFGIAYQECEDGVVGRRGTPAYMSPEQASEETHRIGHSSDIYSLGIVLYELLTGRVPFQGKDRAAIVDSLLTAQVVPPSDLVPNVPAILERICLKAISRSVSVRYAKASDLESDLRSAYERVHDGAEQLVSLAEPHINVRGLRSFSWEDQGFFLKLLPGPYERDGLPESIRFWQQRIDPEKSTVPCAVGVIYGPSGCGKSSFVRAGLLPNIDPQVEVLCVNAEPGDMEARILDELPRAFVANKKSDLRSTISSIREADASGMKWLIVIDQFEQWLVKSPLIGTNPLVQCLRQCDGKRVQALLLVRDEFWMAMHRLMQLLEIPLREGVNSRAIDLFDSHHAKTVLSEFGRAYGTLPQKPNKLSVHQSQFLDGAIEAMSNDGKVSPLQLVLSAQMLKHRDWRGDAQQDFSDATLLGISFLEQSFGVNGPLNYRKHVNVAKRFLAALLPDEADPLLKISRSRSQLQASSGYDDSPIDFEELVEALEVDLRLITRADLPRAKDDHTALDPAYHLTHDCLVAAVDEWLIQKQRESAKGRAEARLDHSTRHWSKRRRRYNLPGFFEWLSILFFWRKLGRREPQEIAMMRAATKWHGLKALSVAFFLSFILGAYLWQRYRLQEEIADRYLTALVEGPSNEVMTALEQLGTLKPSVYRTRIRSVFDTGDNTKKHRAAMVLFSRGELSEEALIDSLSETSLSDYHNFMILLSRRGAEENLPERLLAALEEENEAIGTSLRYAIALLNLDDTRGARHCLALRADPTLRSSFIRNFGKLCRNVESTISWIQGSDDPAVRSGLLESVGHLDSEFLTEDLKSELKEIAVNEYARSPDRAVHGAARWVLKKWGLPLPKLTSSKYPKANANWFMNDHGMTMISLDQGRFLMGIAKPEDIKNAAWGTSVSKEHPVILSQKVYMSANEVPAGLYKQYLMEVKGSVSNLDIIVSPGDESPANGVTWFDAIEFCNWLSLREERRLCYHYENAGDSGRWHCDFEADGYRLPTEAEWEYACRAGTKTLYYFGNESDWISHYGVLGAGRTEEGGMRPPNGWGFFGFIGNVSEWCWDTYKADLGDNEIVDPRAGLGGFEPKVIRGGWWWCAANQLVFAIPYARRPHTEPGKHDSAIGLRVVCRDPRAPSKPIISLSESNQTMLTIAPIKRTLSLVDKGSPMEFVIPSEKEDHWMEAWTECIMTDAAQASWNTHKGEGAFGVGYDIHHSYEDPSNPHTFQNHGLIATDLQDKLYNKCPTVFVRSLFHLDDPELVQTLDFSVRYDDAFIAHINGAEVCRSTGAPVSHGQVFQPKPGETEILLEDYDIQKSRHLLRKGANVLAMQVINSNLNSTDLLLSPTFGVKLVYAPVIYYTTDGSDPRNKDGTIGPSAEVYSEAFDRKNDRPIRARGYCPRNHIWGSLVVEPKSH